MNNMEKYVIKTMLLPENQTKDSTFFKNKFNTLISRTLKIIY